MIFINYVEPSVWTQDIAIGPTSLQDFVRENKQTADHQSGAIWYRSNYKSRAPLKDIENSLHFQRRLCRLHRKSTLQALQVASTTFFPASKRGAIQFIGQKRNGKFQKWAHVLRVWHPLHHGEFDVRFRKIDPPLFALRCRQYPK